MFLLDTHILLWFLNDDPKLPLEVKEILNSKQAIFISIAFFWKMAIYDKDITGGTSRALLAK